MILRTKLVLLLALFLAGAVDCLFALLALWLGWDTGALSGAFFAVFLAVFCVASVGGVTPMIYLDAAQDVELGKVDVEERRAALDRHAAPPPYGREEPGAREDDERGWYIPIEITLLAGQVSGFTDTGLSEIMGSDARPVMQRFLADRGVLTQRPGAAGYGWADGVTLADALRRLRMGDLLPFPAGPAPEVRAPVQPATRRDAPRRSAKGVDRVIEGVKAD